MTTDRDTTQDEQVEESPTPAETEVDEEAPSRPSLQARYTGRYNQDRKYRKSKRAGLTLEKYVPRDNEHKDAQVHCRCTMDDQVSHK